MRCFTGYSFDIVSGFQVSDFGKTGSVKFSPCVGRDAFYGSRSDFLALISGQPDRRNVAAALHWL